ncbi:cyclic GMP-AMP synthase-like receptor [Drosophila biarmipes]|uniref:cyclic GMP-AMP synthase-like receptor n=1 Tax=Drosophila biarmipes TaxID=125945 RepID=UPI0007E63111|nr:cyclic GMP-AMP synthase-like receptor [Drosophila biarmipes]
METPLEEPLKFGAGIDYVLGAISIDDEDRQTFMEDAQQIENEFIRAISRKDPFFASAFRGLSLTGSNLDKVKINLPDEFDMLTTIQLPCEVEPVRLTGQPNYVLLRVRGDNTPYHLVNSQGEENYISRRKVQAWFRDNVNEVIPEVECIHCQGGRTYELKNISGGHVAHTIKATCLSDPSRKICFDFVPAFKFLASQWLRVFPQHPNEDCNWYAVPCKIRTPNVPDDPRSFVVCAPHWERMVLRKKQHLKNGLRLMKASRDANDIPMIFSYTIKSLFLNATKKRMINYNQSPGQVLIRALVCMTWFLRRGFLPFYLVPDASVLEHLGVEQRRDYLKILYSILKRLIKCRERDRMTPDDMQFIFGMQY